MLLRVLFCLLITAFAYFLFAGAVQREALDPTRETFASGPEQPDAISSRPDDHAIVEQQDEASTGKDNPSDTARDDGALIYDSPNMKSKDGFGAQLFLTENEEFFFEWERPEPPRAATVEKARRGVPIFTVIILAGMERDSTGIANVTYDLVVRKPDGSVYSDDQNLIGWRRETPSSPRELQLAEGYVGIVIEEGDPIGTYAVEARVHDHIKDVILDLETKFQVSD